MKPILALIISVTFIIATGCRNEKSASDNRIVAVNDLLSDSLSAGNMDYYISRTAEEKRKALAQNDSDMWANMLTQEAVAAYYQSDPATLLAKSDSAINYLQRHVDEDSEDRNVVAQKAYLTKGAYFSQFDFNPDSAIHYHKLGVEYASRTSDRKALVLAMGNLADTYKLNTRLPEAVDYYHRAITEADSIGCAPAEYISLYGGLAATYTALRDFSQSRIWWDKTMNLYPMMIPYERFNNLNNLGNDFYYRKDYKGALDTFKRLTCYLDSLPQADWEKNFVAINLSDCYLNLNQPDSAAPLLKVSTQYFNEVSPNRVALSYIHSLLMKMYALRGNYAAVEDLIERYPFSDTLRVEQQLSRLEVMADYYEHTGQYRKAMEVSRRHTAIEDTLRSERVEQLAAARRIQYEADTEMLRLRADKVTNEARMLRLWTLFFGALTLVAILAGLIIVLRIRARRNEEKMHSNMIALRMQSVRTRITPHFIFNALNHEILARQSGSPSRLKSIVSLLRHQQYVAEEIVSTLNDELDFVDNYVAVERDAIEGETIYDVSVADGIDTEKVLVPSMSLQILVENAFKHGFRHMPPDAVKHLIIDVSHADSAVKITVFNNSPLRSKSPGSPRTPGGTGLKIILQTLTFINTKTHADIRFDASSGIHPTWGDGTWATITIPDNSDISTLSNEP